MCRSQDVVDFIYKCYVMKSQWGPSIMKREFK